MLGNRQQRDELEGQLAAARAQISELERRLEAESLRDQVTGLPSLAVFERRLDEEVERARRHGRALTVAVLDIDSFRTLNARHGRNLSNDLLRVTGRALDNLMRATDLVSRASADEFLVVLPETTAEETARVFERILLELEAISVGPVESVAASVGIAAYSRPMSSEELAAAAGKGLDQARKGGGARAVIQETGMKPTAPDDQAHQDAIAGLAEALLERDRYTGEHSASVVELVRGVAKSLGLDDDETEKIKVGALLHDIGKVAMPDEILHKAGPLDDDQWEIMRQHPIVGERILRAIPGLGPIARIVRHEHERWDGTGYPDGISGREIPVGSRIVLACDAYHAMTSDRPYRKAMSHGEAIRELGEGAGTQFDPEVTEMLIGCLYGKRQSGIA
jgi:diguanylate cyclase (GGDEF)-like protein/putative nucleotidyltransferase with HDIG domain